MATTLKDQLQNLRIKLDQVLALKQNRPEEGNSTEVKEFYRTDLLPYMLQLRKLNRSEKIALEVKYKKVKELQHNLYDIQQVCDNLAFEADCLGTEVSKISPNMRTPQDDQVNGMEVDSNEIPKQNGKYFDPDAVARNDHSTRLRLLAEEQARRIILKEKLNRIKDEAKNLEASRKHNVNQFNQLKPPIKQLIERVESIKPNIK